MTALEEAIRKHVLKNAFDFGKANPGSVAGKVIAEQPDAKGDMKTTMRLIAAEIARVSKLSKDDIGKEMSAYEYYEKKEEKKELEIEGAEEGKVVVRYPPAPNGWPHIGHAKAFSLSSAIAERYKGRVILRWDDTNPEAEKEEYLAAIREGIKWLGLSWDQEEYCSDHMDEMYRLAERLISRGDAYACSCAKEDISKGREEMKRCACASKGKEEHLSLWRGMIDGTVPEGGATLRLKGDMSSLNTVMRDPTLFRIITAPHYRQKERYRLWPTYDFQGAVMDSVLGITAPLRSKEYELRDELYVYLLEKLGLPVPRLISISRLAIKNAPISKRLLRPLVESGKLWGWDDPRLPTLAGLRRRGMQPDAIKAVVLSFGLSKVESEPDWEALLSENRKLLDPVADHYYFVPDPVRVDVQGLEAKDVQLKLHPKKGEGMRTIKAGPALHIPRSDADQVQEGEIFRLKDLCNVEVISKGADGLTCRLVPDSGVQRKVQWVGPDSLPCSLFYPKDHLKDGEFDPQSLVEVKGLCEEGVEGVPIGAIVQFERVGFCRKDQGEGIRFIHTC